MIAVRFLIILAIMLGLYFIFIYTNLGPVEDSSIQSGTALLYESLDVYPFVCYLPKGYGEQEKTFPLILYLHDHSNSIEHGKEQALNQSPITYAASHESFPFLIAAPLTGSDGWDSAVLFEFLVSVQEQFDVNPQQIYLTGMGEGADTVWMMSVFFTDRFAAIAPLAGVGEPKSAREHLTDLPVWIFHGKQDKVVAVENSLIMAGALNGYNDNISYTLYPDRGHSIWNDVYNTPNLYDWFLQYQTKVPVINNDP